MLVNDAGQKVLKQLNDAGYDAYFVGGIVRDALLGQVTYDADITTSAAPDVILNLFEKTIATGLQHGTVTVVMDEKNIEVTTFRLDGDYLDHRHPEHVTFTQSLSSDLSRRDFTINAIAQALEGDIIDPFNGQADLKAKIIRAVGNPVKRFEEDALRILRGIRFVAKLGFDIEEKTLTAMKSCQHLLVHLSLERIRKEFEGIIKGAYRFKALKMMRDCEIFIHTPYFSSFHAFNDEQLEKLDDFKLAILLMQADFSHSSEFLTTFPLKRSEKKLIQVINKIWCEFQHENESHDKLIQYYYGIETLQMAKKYVNIIDVNKNEAETFLPFDLAIENRSDILIQPKELLELSDEEPGGWINELFIEIEEAIILGKVENNKAALMTFIKERGIFDVKKT